MHPVLRTVLQRLGLGVITLFFVSCIIFFSMELLPGNFAYAILGVVLMYASYRIIDRLTPAVDFPEELKRGNIAVAIFIAALFLSIAIIVGNALS